MRKKSTKAAKKRTPPAMPTPSPILRPVLEELDDDWVVPVSRGDPEPEEEAAEEMVEEVGPALVEPLDVVVVGLVLPVDDGDEEEVEEVDVISVNTTYSIVVGTEAEKSAGVVGV
jgi:hypothetical protein